jgi:hypothetical protein
VNTSCPRRVRPPLGTCRVNDRRMYLLLTTVTGDHQCDVRENIDEQAASTDGRATFYVNGQTHMFERTVVMKKTTGGF